jgi:predicted small lipoprotein YifL
MPLRLTALAALAIALTGCGLSDPYDRPQPKATFSTARSSTTTSRGPTVVTVTSSSTTTAGNPGERNEGATPPSHVRVRTGLAAPRAEAALERFTRLYINWTAGELPARSRQLAELATGQAQAQALALAGRAALLSRYRVANSGTVTAIAAGQGSEHGRWAVVTNELTTGTGPYVGLPATSHVTWATVIHTGHGYVIDGWYPAS